MRDFHESDDQRRWDGYVSTISALIFNHKGPLCRLRDRIEVGEEVTSIEPITDPGGEPFSWLVHYRDGHSCEFFRIAEPGCGVVSVERASPHSWVDDAQPERSAWPLGINPEMDRHAAIGGLAHWSCVSPRSNDLWMRRDGRRLEVNFRAEGGYRDELRAFDRRSAVASAPGGYLWKPVDPETPPPAGPYWLISDDGGGPKLLELGDDRRVKVDLGGRSAISLWGGVVKIGDVYAPAIPPPMPTGGC